MRTVRLRGRVVDPASGEYDERFIDLQVGESGTLHGEQVTKSAIGTTGTLTPSGSITTTADGQVYENLEISGRLDVRHHVTLRNCRIVGSPGLTAGVYTIKHTASTGKRLTLEDCEVITRTDVTKGLVSWGNAGVYAHRTIFRGGTDNVFVKNTGDHFEGYANVFRECWFGDVQRYSGSHSDCIQIETATGMLFERCRVMSYNIPVGADPLTVEADGSELASGGIICTQNSASPTQIDRVHIIDCWAEGGNTTIDTEPPDGLTPTNGKVHGCRFGVAHRYAPIRAQNRIGNTWGESGVTACCGTVTAGQALSGG